MPWRGKWVCLTSPRWRCHRVSSVTVGQELASFVTHLDPSIKWPAFCRPSTASSRSFVYASHLNQRPFFNQSTPLGLER